MPRYSGPIRTVSNPNVNSGNNVLTGENNGLVMQSGSLGSITNPPTDAFIIEAVANAAAADTVTIVNASFGQATVITLPDPGTATATVDVTPGGLLSAGAITASTTHTQLGATPVTAVIEAVTVANASDAILLPAAVPGIQISLVNVSNAAGTIFPAGTDQINNAGASTSVALTSGSTTGVTTLVTCAVAGHWVTK